MTIKQMIVSGLLKAEMSANDDDVERVLRESVKKISSVFQNDTPEGRDFCDVMTRVMPSVSAENKGDQTLLDSAADNVVDNAVEWIVDRIMKKGYDLESHHDMRAKLVEEIEK